MVLTLPGGQGHTGHLRRAGVVLLLVGGRVKIPIPSPIQGILGELKEPVGSRPLLTFHPSLGNAIFKPCYLFVCSVWELERGLIASCPPVTLFTLMFTASKLSMASRAPPLPAKGELTVSIG